MKNKLITILCDLCLMIIMGCPLKNQWETYKMFKHDVTAIKLAITIINTFLFAVVTFADIMRLFKI